MSSQKRSPGTADGPPGRAGGPRPEAPDRRAASRDQPADASGSGPAGRGRGPLESLFQEALRRATTAGLSGFFFTEEAVRRALSESVPEEWTSFLAQQRTEVRDEMIERIGREVGSWLGSLDAETLIRAALDSYDFHIEIDVRSRHRADADPGSLRVVPRPK